MEFGDIIYFILLAFFVILGFFNDSRKKKQQQQKSSETESPPFVISPPLREKKRKTLSPPLPAAYSEPDVRKEFQSSINLVSIHDDQPTHASYSFDYDANSFYESDPDAPDRTREEKIERSFHPLIDDLRDEAGREALKKGLIYGEIMQRRY